MKVKKFSTVADRLHKRYPYPKAIVSVDYDKQEFGLTKLTQKGNPSYIVMHPKKEYQAIYDGMTGHYKFFEKESGKRIRRLKL